MKLCDLNTSKALHALGYDGQTTRWYNRDGELREWHLVDDEIAAPRLDDAAYFLRDKYRIIVYVRYSEADDGADEFDAYVEEMDGPAPRYLASFAYYETALGYAVKKAIRIIKDRQQ